MDKYEFLEQCENDLINKLCFKCPELTLAQIDVIIEIFRDEIDKQLVDDGIIIGK